MRHVSKILTRYTVEVEVADLQLNPSNIIQAVNWHAEGR